MPRNLSTIAEEISRDIGVGRAWSARASIPAMPYVSAMRSLSTIDDYYGLDTGKSIVNYFLANAGTWRGETARRIKAELKDLLAGKG